MQIQPIVKIHGLHSVSVLKSDGIELTGYRAKVPPISPASTLKLVIADVLLKSRLKLDIQLSVTEDVFYEGKNTLGEARISLAEALFKMLSISDNTAANVLINALGGTDGFTLKAHEAGYWGTKIKAYYGQAGCPVNKSPIFDQTRAMIQISSNEGANYRVAQKALRLAAETDNKYDLPAILNKWAGNPWVCGNVGLFQVKGQRYAIGLYIEKPYPVCRSGIHNGTMELVSSIEHLPSR